MFFGSFSSSECETLFGLFFFLQIFFWFAEMRREKIRALWRFLNTCKRLAFWRRRFSNRGERQKAKRERRVFIVVVEIQFQRAEFWLDWMAPRLRFLATPSCLIHFARIGEGSFKAANYGWWWLPRANVLIVGKTFSDHHTIPSLSRSTTTRQVGDDGELECFFFFILRLAFFSRNVCGHSQHTMDTKANVMKHRERERESETARSSNQLFPRKISKISHGIASRQPPTQFPTSQLTARHKSQLFRVSPSTFSLHLGKKKM